MTHKKRERFEKRKIELLLEGFHNGESWLFFFKKTKYKKSRASFLHRAVKAWSNWKPVTEKMKSVNSIKTEY